MTNIFGKKQIKPFQYDQNNTFNFVSEAKIKSIQKRKVQKILKHNSNFTQSAQCISDDIVWIEIINNWCYIDTMC